MTNAPADTRQDILEAERAIDAALTALVQKHGGAVGVTVEQRITHTGGNAIMSEVSLTFSVLTPRAIRQGEADHA